MYAVCYMVLFGESFKELIMRAYEEWRKALESRDVKINVGKTKGMCVSRAAEVNDYRKWPCGVFKKISGVNPIKCSSCARWVHVDFQDLKGV